MNPVVVMGIDIQVTASQEATLASPINFVPSGGATFKAIVTWREE